MLNNPWNLTILGLENCQLRPGKINEKKKCWESLSWSRQNMNEEKCEKNKGEKDDKKIV